MTKKEIVATIAHELKETQLKTKDIVQRTFNAIVDTLIKEPSHRIELRNFGVFEVKARKPRKARNPRTGDKVDVPAKAVVTFKPGKYMEERVREIPLSDLVEDEEDKDTASNGQELDGTAKTGKTRRKRKSTA